MHSHILHYYFYNLVSYGGYLKVAETQRTPLYYQKVKTYIVCQWISIMNSASLFAQENAY